MAKRVFDLIISFILLVILFPVMLITALVVIFDAGFPVFYRGPRVGKDGQAFEMLKFRSMAVGSSEKGPAVTTGSDRRVTGSGRFLRRWKLDELPQFVNVLLGEMSLVGPRPEDPKYVKHYTEKEREVLSVKPGVTGLSQILYRNEEQILDAQNPEDHYRNCIMRRKLSYDLIYIRQRSAFLDLMIVFLTILIIFLPRKGAGLCQRTLERVVAGENNIDPICQKYVNS